MDMHSLVILRKTTQLAEQRGEQRPRRERAAHQREAARRGGPAVERVLRQGQRADDARVVAVGRRHDERLGRRGRREETSDKKNGWMDYMRGSL